MAEFVLIRPVAEPKDYSKVRFTKGEYALAKKIGEVQVSPMTAQEAIKNSKGLYEIKPVVKAEMEVKVEGLSLDAMTNDQLKIMALQLGFAVRKKNMQRSELVAFVKGKLDSLQVVDDAPEEGDDEEAAEADGEEDSAVNE